MPCSEERHQLLAAFLHDRAHYDLRDVPVRQRSANGKPPPRSEFLRACEQCRAGFNELTPGETGERGLWSDVNSLSWWCSQECWDVDHGRAK